MSSRPDSGGKPTRDSDLRPGREFDRHRDRYDDLINESIAFSGLKVDFFTRAKARHLLETVRRELGDPGVKDALDVGCGKGSIHPYLSGEFRSLTGVDVASELIDAARSANPAVRYRSFDGVSLPFDSGSFDVVFAICVLHHVPPAGWMRFVAEMGRAARLGGLVMVFEHNPWNFLTRFAVSRCEFDEDAVLLRASRTRGLLAGAGLAELQTRFIIFTPVEGRMAAFLDRSLRRCPIGAQYFVYGRKI